MIKSIFTAKTPRTPRTTKEKIKNGKELIEKEKNKRDEEIKLGEKIQSGNYDKDDVTRASSKDTSRASYVVANEEQAEITSINPKTEALAERNAQLAQIATHDSNEINLDSIPTDDKPSTQHKKDGQLTMSFYKEIDGEKKETLASEFNKQKSASETPNPNVGPIQKNSIT